jgi:probable FeS assembly SUF system protein SufT
MMRNMLNQPFVLLANCPATVIPAGDPVAIPAGTEVEITQSLGGSVTLRAKGNLFRVDPEYTFAFPESIRNALEEEERNQPQFDGEFSESWIWQALRTCFDPEIPVNIVDLGLIYDLSIEPDAAVSGKHKVSVKMTLTAQGCGMGPAIAADAQRKIEAIDQVSSAQVDIVWDPVWTPHMISPEGRKALGLE